MPRISHQLIGTTSRIQRPTLHKQMLPCSLLLPRPLLFFFFFNIPLDPAQLPNYLLTSNLSPFNPYVLVWAAIKKKVPQTRWLISSRNLFLIVLDTGSPRSRQQHGWGLVRAPFQVAEGCLFLASSPGRKGELWLLQIFIRALIPFIRPLPS